MLEFESPRPACGERSDCAERCEASSGAIRVRGSLRESRCRESPSPQPSPREERGEGAVINRCRLNLDLSGTSGVMAAPAALSEVDTASLAVRLRGVTKVYDNAVAALGPLDLDVRKGEFVSLLGPSGCGKSTALRLIAGLNAPSSGEVVVAHRD